MRSRHGCRASLEPRYGAWWAPTYAVDADYPNASHRDFIQKFIEIVPKNSLILDAACGTGRYMSQILESGHSLIGIDQAGGMLERARGKFPQVQFEKMGMQEMSFENVFDGVTCMDAMEHVCPEDWTVVLKNFYRALKQQGYLYFKLKQPMLPNFELLAYETFL